MKIRTVLELQDAIDKDLAWRKPELSALKSNISRARSFAKETALRSGIALLYAHWEGSIKNLAYYYLQYVAYQKIPYDKLKPNFLAITVKQDLNGFVETNKSTLQTEVVKKIFVQHTQISHIPTEGIISAKSNLNSEILTEIMCTLGLSTAEYENSYTLIDEVLLKMRNGIAHGEHLESISLDEERYNEIHEKVLGLISQFSIQISNAASLKHYLKEPE